MVRAEQSSAAPHALIPLALIAFAGLACRDQHMAPNRDAGSDGIRSDVSMPLTLDIAVTGCASFDTATVACSGSPPLALAFAPVGSPELSRFLWTFGDGTPPTTERAPSHTYSHPDRYQVTLVGGTTDIGMVMAPQPLTVIVAALPTGAPCDVDAQCDSTAGLTCMCAPGSGCAPTFFRGVCSMSCAAESCGADAVCAAAAVGPRADAGVRSSLCLRGCQTNAQCAPGFVCQTLPVGSTADTARWTRGCLPLGVARDVGASCRDANEVLQDDACATGTCADVGALGVCSASCDDTHPCPDGSACAQLPDGRAICLLSCTFNDNDCTGDPLLACVAAPASGASGTVDVCAAKVCSGDVACAPSGRCGPEGVCIRKG
jgi:hypothetical protein